MELTQKQLENKILNINSMIYNTEHDKDHYGFGYDGDETYEQLEARIVELENQRQGYQEELKRRFGVDFN